MCDRHLSHRRPGAVERHREPHQTWSKRTFYARGPGQNARLRFTSIPAKTLQEPFPQINSFRLWRFNDDDSYSGCPRPAAFFLSSTLEFEMTIMVTGGAGYIGSHTCVELIKSRYTIVIFDNFSNGQPEVLERIKRITGVFPAAVRGAQPNRDWRNSRRCLRPAWAQKRPEYTCHLPLKKRARVPARWCRAPYPGSP